MVASQPYLSLIDRALPSVAGAAKAMEAAADTQVFPQYEAASTNPHTIASLQMLVAASSLGPADERRRAQIAKARHGLDGLDRLHREMLSGAASRASLVNLATWLQDQPQSEDPKFTQLFEELELRVRVELAKFDIEV
jgi:hypothetical protein